MKAKYFEVVTLLRSTKCNDIRYSSNQLYKKRSYASKKLVLLKKSKEDCEKIVNIKAGSFAY